MGLIKQTHSVPTYGLTLSDVYIAFATNAVVLHPVGRATYDVVANYGVWTSKASRDSGGAPIEVSCLQALFSGELSGLYAFMYDEVKNTHDGCTDVFE